MLQQYHRTTGKLQTSFIKFCPTTPVFLETKHEGEVAPIESTWCIFKRSEGRKSHDKREKKGSPRETDLGVLVNTPIRRLNTG
jgi:hypothetical protein